MALKRTRQKAMENGDLYYKTFQPCKNGHIAKRYTLNGVCMICNLERNQKVRDQIKSTRKSKKA